MKQMNAAERAARKEAMVAEKLTALGFTPEQIETVASLNRRRAAWVAAGGLPVAEFLNHRVNEWAENMKRKNPNAYHSALFHAMYGSTAFEGVDQFDLPGEDSVLAFADTLEEEIKALSSSRST